MEIPEEVIKRTAKRMRWLSAMWNEEIPLRIHSHEIDDGGAPQWHPDFALWMSRTEVKDKYWRERPEARVKTTRAFRKLRRHHPREFEVLYRTAILGIPIKDTVEWMNDRAVRNEKVERYTYDDIVVYLIVATDKVVSWL